MINILVACVDFESTTYRGIVNHQKSELWRHDAMWGLWHEMIGWRSMYLPTSSCSNRVIGQKCNLHDFCESSDKHLMPSLSLSPVLDQVDLPVHKGRPNLTTIEQMFFFHANFDGNVVYSRNCNCFYKHILKQGLAKDVSHGGRLCEAENMYPCALNRQLESYLIYDTTFLCTR